ncbi:MAG: hypothetical protein B6U89_04925 [Desulfurococcales archaeon ex4484_58]|nr:MAG: hypothetical protein B6U89_04925 [Desulfurococcales archaeon ex4484_58]
MGEEYCGNLREAVELLVILNQLSKRKSEYGVDMRISNLLDKKEVLVNTILNYCGEDAYASYNEAINDIEDEEKIIESIKILHECMIRYGCVSNVSLEE